MSNGIVLYRGPSMLDGAPIVVIATGIRGRSNNAKTGDMVQTWILREDVSPIDAINSGADASICGDCPHRGTTDGVRVRGRSCYVLVFQAPQNVWKTYKRGGYEIAASLEDVGRDRVVRLGSYGDPAAVPLDVWSALTKYSKFHTGYTHQWRDFPELAPFCMASADSSADRAAARMLGFRVFRVRTEHDPVEDREVICPASAEAGYKTNCATCRACGGTGAKAKADIVIMAHGNGAGHVARRAAA